MSSPDPEISALYSRLEEVLGHPHADTPMSRLPPLPSELATRTDVEGIATHLDRLETRFDRFETRFDGLETRLDQRLLSFEERIDARLGRFDDRLDRMQDLMHIQFKNFSIVAASFMTGMTAVFGIMLAAFG
jgi:hypothetical protein